jgi:hypothetical protein
MPDPVIHLVKEMKGGLATSKCGEINLSAFERTVWWGQVTCPECRPYQWVPHPDGLGKHMVDVRAEPVHKKRRRLIRVPD